MADVLQRALSRLADVFESHVSQSVTYTRGTSTVTVSASVSNSNAMLTDVVGNTRLALDELDFDIKVDSLGMEPREGDTITFDGNVYRVCKPDVNTRAYDDDEYGIGYVIHTKRIGTT